MRLFYVYQRLNGGNLGIDFNNWMANEEKYVYRIRVRRNLESYPVTIL